MHPIALLLPLLPVLAALDQAIDKQQDIAEHECRVCKAIDIDSDANCPSEGFFCGPEQPLSASVLTEEDPCRCQSLKCAAPGWRLAVDGSIVDKIQCRSRQWTTAAGDDVPSVVCAQACKVCEQSLITISPTTADGGWDLTIVPGKCTSLSATCTGPPGVVAKVNGETIAPDRKVVAECNGYGTAWLYEGQEVKTLDCQLPGCMKCGSTVSIEGALDYAISIAVDSSSGCLVHRVMCASPSRTGNTFVDFDGGATTGPHPSPTAFDLACSDDGTAWQFMGETVTTGTCNGDDIACTSVPHASTADGYTITHLKSRPFENGAAVYSCDAPEIMLSVDGPTVTELSETAKIVCDLKSGTFVDESGEAVATKTFACGTKQACKACNQDLISVSPTTADGGWETVIIDGECTQLSATCTGPAGVVAKVNGQSITPDSTVIAECNGDNTAWLYNGQPVTTLDCAIPACQKCSPKLDITTSGGAQILNNDAVTSGCVVQQVSCYGPARTTVDFNGGLSTGPVTSPNNFDLTCAEDGTAWQYMGRAVTEATCYGEPLACPRVPQTTYAAGYATTPLKIRPPENEAEIYSCDAPEVMLSVDGTTITELAQTAKIVCKLNSGTFVDENGAVVGTKTFACGTKEACTCNLAKLVDPGDAACQTQDAIDCTAKPTTSPDCSTVSCAGALHLLRSSTVSELVNPAFVTCEAGVWKYNLEGDAIPNDAPGFVCGKEHGCSLLSAYPLGACQAAAQNTVEISSCVAATITSDSVTCDGSGLIVYANAGNFAILTSITCDKASSRWKYSTNSVTDRDLVDDGLGAADFACGIPV